MNPERRVVTRKGNVFRGLLVMFGALAVVVLYGCAAQKHAEEASSPSLPSGADTHCPAPPPAPDAAKAHGRRKAKPEPPLQVDADGLSLESVLIKTDDGDIRFRFYPHEAPCTVARFRTLVRSGFYNGLVFHRVVPGFVIQGGDPNGNGTGGSGFRLAPEFNEHKHVKGTLAMARSRDPGSADSQFYIALGTLPQLDGSYTIFGQVVEGMDVLDKVQVGEVMRKVSLEKDKPGAQH